MHGPQFVAGDRCSQCPTSLRQTLLISGAAEAGVLSHIWREAVLISPRAPCSGSWLQKEELCGNDLCLHELRLGLH